MENSVITALQNIVVDFDGEPILTGLSLEIHDKEFVTARPFGLRQNDDAPCHRGICRAKIGQCFF